MTRRRAGDWPQNSFSWFDRKEKPRYKLTKLARSKSFYTINRPAQISQFNWLEIIKEYSAGKIQEN